MPLTHYVYTQCSSLYIQFNGAVYQTIVDAVGRDRTGSSRHRVAGSVIWVGSGRVTGQCRKTLTRVFLAGVDFCEPVTESNLTDLCNS